MNSQSILSNAFSASRLRSSALVPVRWTCSIMSIIFRVLSEACLPATNPTWSLSINLGKMGFNLFASILLYSLRSQLSREIGR
ncbi:hypothetical protein FKM82_019708 [Ascaphus truei]